MRQYDTKASFGHRTYKHRTDTERELIAGALVHDVSVLSPSVPPAEPLAQVILLKRSAPAERAPARTAAPTAEPAYEVIIHPPHRIRRVPRRFRF